jgi:hypothetical protein
MLAFHVLYNVEGLLKKSCLQIFNWGDVVAQLVKATGRHQTEDAAVPGSNLAPPTVT